MRRVTIHAALLADVLQNSAPLAQDVRIAQKLAVVGRTCLRELRIQIAAAQRGRSLNEEKILRGEEHHRQNADEVALTEILSGVLDAPPRAALKSKRKFPRHIVPHKAQTDMRPVVAHTNKLRIAGCAMGASECGVVERLNYIRLALRVRPEKDLCPVVKTERKILIIPIRTQRELCYLHLSNPYNAVDPDAVHRNHIAGHKLAPARRLRLSVAQDPPA